MTNTTLKKISELLGISISTASRALKNHPDISEKTKKKVMELAATLDYEPNANAIYLRTSNRKLLGLMVPTISNHFYDSFIAAVEEEGRKNGYTLMILQSGDDPQIELTNLRLCRQNRISGLFVCITPETQDMSPFMKMQEMEIPVVFFDKVPEVKDWNKVCLADAEAAQLAAGALMNSHKKNILAVWGNVHLSITRRRMQAFEEIMRESKTKVSVTNLHAFSFDEAQQVTKQALSGENEYDTLFCMSDEILAGAMKAIQSLQLRIPKDIAVIAISNGFIPRLFSPEITYVETSGYQLGKIAFGRMMECIKDRASVEELTVGARLVPGGSL
jgi:LacI family transcriptional regulator